MATQTQTTQEILEARTARDLSVMANEPVRCEIIGTWMYAFGSELAMLRIFNKYNMVAGAKIVGRVCYSSSKVSHYFTIEIKS